MKTICTPESTGSGSCVQVDEGTGRLYVQSFDSYGYQRELILSRRDEGWELHTYQHPGRRHIRKLTEKAGKELQASLCYGFTHHAALYFNKHDEHRAKNEGFVRLQEAIFIGITNLSPYL